MDDVGASDDKAVVTKRGKPVAKLVPLPERYGNSDLIGILKGKVFFEDDPKDEDYFSTGAWVSDEWGDLNNG